MPIKSQTPNSTIVAPHPQELRISDYRYDLPNERIAQFPLEERDASKLLVYDKGNIESAIFRNLENYLPENSLLVFNNSKVIQARLVFRTPTGSEIEIFCLEPYQPAVSNGKGVALWKCFVGNAKRWKISQLATASVYEGKPIHLSATQVLQQQDYYIIQFEWLPSELSFDEILGVLGFLPLPPYMNRAATEEDKLRYQTIYARFDGSVAAPTAGLHFTDRVLDGLAKKEIHIEFVTLHVGAGTFKPVKSDTMAGHAMHDERVIVSKQTIQQLLSYKESITAVGTTSLRTLESLYWLGVKLSSNKDLKPEELVIDQWFPYQFSQQDNAFIPLHPLTYLLDYLEMNKLDHISFRTFIIIAPGYSFQMVHLLITNFHQPESTLILLVAAFIGENWRKVYQYALDHQYRFLSYGDSSLLFRNETTE